MEALFMRGFLTIQQKFSQKIIHKGKQNTERIEGHLRSRLVKKAAVLWG